MCSKSDAYKIRAYIGLVATAQTKRTLILLNLNNWTFYFKFNCPFLNFNFFLKSFLISNTITEQLNTTTYHIPLLTMYIICKNRYFVFEVSDHTGRARLFLEERMLLRKTHIFRLSFRWRKESLLLRLTCVVNDDPQLTLFFLDLTHTEFCCCCVTTDQYNIHALLSGRDSPKRGNQQHLPD